MRAVRRHHRERILARRREIARRVSSATETRDPRIRHWHFNCNCFECPEERRAERRKADRDARRAEEIAAGIVL